MEDWIVKNEGTAYCKTYFFKESLARIFFIDFDGILERHF
jgi:hypothetical protein